MKPSRAELDHWCDVLKQPSGAYSFMVILTKEHQQQLRALLPKRHFVTPPHPDKDLRKDGLRCIIVPDTEAAFVGRMIFSDGDPDLAEPMELTVQREHEWRRQHGKWPWDARRPRCRASGASGPMACPEASKGTSSA